MNRIDATLDTIIKAVGDSPDAPMIAAKAQGLMIGYEARWRDQPYVNLASEREYYLPLINPDTGKPSRTWLHGGKIDGEILCRLDGRRLVREHKTTSDDITDPDAPYWRRLSIDSQISHYALGQWQEGTKIDGVLYDVIRKPGIRPKKVAAGKKGGDAEIGTQREIDERGTYFGYPVPLDEPMSGEETPFLYSLRLAAETVADPARYFGRKVIYRLDAELLEYARELWDIGQDIMTTEKTGRHYRNSGACMAWGSPCLFLGICSGHDSPDSDHWRTKPNVHAELESAPGDGRNVLTTSRRQVYQTCKRKHHLQYGVGLARVNEDERESLWFGSIIHKALETWWNFYNEKGESHDDHGNGAALNEGGCAANRQPHGDGIHGPQAELVGRAD